MKILNIITGFFYTLYKFLQPYIKADLYFGINPGSIKHKSRNSAIILFPCYNCNFLCGLAGIVSFVNNKTVTSDVNINLLTEITDAASDKTLQLCETANLSLEDHYLGGKNLVESLLIEIRALKQDSLFHKIFLEHDLQNKLKDISRILNELIAHEARDLNLRMGLLGKTELASVSERLEVLRDAAWSLEKESLGNIKKVHNLLQNHETRPSFSTLVIFKKINAVLNSIDCLEVRGRDSTGISIFFGLEKADFEPFLKALRINNKDKDLTAEFKKRSEYDVLVNRGISVSDTGNNEQNDAVVIIALTYKVAAEIGSLGDNINYIRRQVMEDPILHLLAGFPGKYNTISAHTRWASIGAITEPNCHPVDNKTIGGNHNGCGIIHVCLNGDIDNYRVLKTEYEEGGGSIHQDISTDTKIIPLQIEKYLNSGMDIFEAFRMAVNDFEGSHAISMHTNLAPGKLFLAQRGSGQAVFVGLGDNHYLASSEVYGFIEETSRYLKMDGEKIVTGTNGHVQGQIFVLTQESAGGLDGVEAVFYDGSPVNLDKNDIKYTEITSRDINRQDFPHYFLKEISESPLSVEKTLLNKWRFDEHDTGRHALALDEIVFPKSLKDALSGANSDLTEIKRIFFVGQGTAGVAAQACADILNYYMSDPGLYVGALKASELSGFTLNDHDNAKTMADALVVAISQSGTTTDTNRAVDMVRERGAHTLCIVNRRDSDLTFKVDGVMYTSSGRDIEMSVASTKAFYSQIIAGALLGLNIALLKGKRDTGFADAEIKALLKLPDQMREILSQKEAIRESARSLAPLKPYWAAVGSGPNKVSADEIRIKLSELCYKTISSDFIEDKKHIDLSSEPLIIVCAAGANDSVIGDIIKDTAIFHAHKAAPVVIANEGETGFEPYAESIFYVPIVSQHLAPVVNTLVGHIWGYYAALAINEGSIILHTFREELQAIIDDYTRDGLSGYEIILENRFREKIALFYNEFRAMRTKTKYPTAITNSSDLILILKYLSGRLPVSDFEIDFGQKGTALKMLDILFNCLGESINAMSRPVDAIKHQAKTVTVGTSRISAKVEGLIFDAVKSYDLRISQILNRNVLVLKNLQGIVSKINGAILYKISGLSILGYPSENTMIDIVHKDGSLAPLLSRVEKEKILRGTKEIIIRQQNVYIGKGRKDDRNIIIIPVLSASSERPNIIEHMLLLHISFKENIPLPVKIKALGGKYNHIKNIVQENSLPWDDKYIEMVKTDKLFGRSAEKIGEYIASRLKAAP
jgi:glucosamine--fructose-6-phosphate aminotransferase (isomerizing)